ncbi:TadE/TadG family type IV pilus assembly protein [Natranaerofaba carboxydovora]|uniref:TadE/TadG family type IV pilus assembly protein n=1 Tax=Natranaerofaba carboxydovora TaxID=2742683 RepID=UPI001F138C1D|nr:TadE family protein [Natranaerofaba carboxydovora]UMZ75036.1 TadE-like protein [Natranaerofaba carboxydovora]
MLKKMSRTLRKDDGQALVELAFVLPILLLLVFGIIEFGNIYFAHLTLNNASREGARAGALRATQHGVDLEAEVNEVIQNRIPSLDSDNLSVFVWPNSEEELIRGNDLKVELEYNRRLLTPLFGMILDDGAGYYQLRTETTMRIE